MARGRDTRLAINQGEFIDELDKISGGVYPLMDNRPAVPDGEILDAIKGVGDAIKSIGGVTEKQIDEKDQVILDESKKYTDEEIAKVEAPDLSTYETKTEHKNDIDELSKRIDDLPAQVDAYTKSETDALLDEKQDKGDYALKSDIPNLEDYATKEELDEKQDKGDYALKSDIPNLDEYATKQYVDDEIGKIEIPPADESLWEDQGGGNGVLLRTPRPLNLQNLVIHNVGDPVQDFDAVHKQYLEDQLKEISNGWIVGEYKYVEPSVVMPVGWKRVANSSRQSLILASNPEFSGLDNGVNFSFQDTNTGHPINLNIGTDGDGVAYMRWRLLGSGNTSSSTLHFQTTALYLYDPDNFYSDSQFVYVGEEDWRNFQLTREAHDEMERN